MSEWGGMKESVCVHELERERQNKMENPLEGNLSENVCTLPD